MSNNEWFERGELPPVGSHIEVTFGNKPIWHECVILPSKKIAIDRYAGWHVMPWQDDFVFRPLKTERDRAIEEMHIIANQGSSCASIGAIEKLYDAGFRKTEV